VAGLAAGFTSSITGASENMIDIFLEASACKASSINTVVLSSSLVQHRSPVVGVLGQLELSALGKVTKGRSYTLPIDVVECGIFPGSC
jgi:hypothetical protein